VLTGLVSLDARLAPAFRSTTSYTECRTLVLQFSFIVWGAGTSADLDSIDDFLSFYRRENDLRNYNKLLHIKNAVNAWGVNFNKWKHRIINTIETQSPIYDILSDTFAWNNAISTETSNPVRSCTAKISFGVDIIDDDLVRVEGQFQLGRFYYCIQDDETLTLRCPGNPEQRLGFPLFVHTDSARSASYVSQNLVYSKTNEITDYIVQDLIARLRGTGLPKVEPKSGVDINIGRVLGDVKPPV
jgi:hypothetical protein